MKYGTITLSNSEHISGIVVKFGMLIFISICSFKSNTYSFVIFTILFETVQPLRLDGSVMSWIIHWFLMHLGSFWIKCIRRIFPPLPALSSEPFFSRLQKVFCALGRKYYILLTIFFCILAIYFCTHEYLEQNPILLLNSLMMCLKICEKFFWIIM